MKRVRVSWWACRGKSPNPWPTTFCWRGSCACPCAGWGRSFPRRIRLWEPRPGGTAALTCGSWPVLRIALPRANIPATTALATVDAVAGQKEGLLAGGNVLMPGFTPPGYREHYRIYDNKNRVDTAAARMAVEAAGRTHTLASPPESEENPGGRRKKHELFIAARAGATDGWSLIHLLPPGGWNAAYRHGAYPV